MELLLAALLGAAPQVQNRAPRPDELGYRPEDGAVVSLTPPSFAWLHEPAARTYAVQWAAREDWSVARRFTVPPDAVPFPMPTRAERRERVQILGADLSGRVVTLGHHNLEHGSRIVLPAAEGGP